MVLKLLKRGRTAARSSTPIATYLDHLTRSLLRGNPPSWRRRAAMMYRVHTQAGTSPSGWTRVFVAILTFSLALACSDSDSPAQPDNSQGPGNGPGANPGAAAGTIAYVRGGEIRLINPDGTGDRLLWRTPRPELGFTVTGMAWRPDGAELAFASNHEMATSWFERDIYGIGADGTGLRRLTNAPAHDKLGSLEKG